MTGMPLDLYRQGTSALHRADARVKLLVTLGAIVAVNLTPLGAWPVLATHLAALVAVNGVARVALRVVVGRAATALPFVALSALGVPFAAGGAPLLRVEVLGLPLTVTDAGFARLAEILVHAGLSILFAISLTATTPFTELVGAMRSLGMPRLLVATIAMMVRYLHVLVDEAGRLMRAREARSGAFESARAGGSLGWRARVTGHMIGTLLIRTYERSERIYRAMLARGYNGEIVTLRAQSLSPSARLALCGALALIAGATALARLIWPS